MSEKPQRPRSARAAAAPQSKLTHKSNASQLLPCVSIDASAGSCLQVKVSPGASSSRILGLHGDALKVAVAAPPERGKANAAVVDLLAAELGLPKRAIELQSGQTAARKRFRISGIAPAELSLRVERCLP